MRDNHLSVKQQLFSKNNEGNNKKSQLLVTRPQLDRVRRLNSTIESQVDE